MTEKPIVTVCCLCKSKIKHAASSNIWSNLSARSYREILKGEYVQISHGYCPDCFAIEERKAIEFERKQKEG